MDLKRICRGIIIFCVCFMLSVHSGKSQVKKEILQGAISKIEITPDIPVMLYGYGSRKTPSEGIHDPLYARAVVFENSGGKLVLVSTDIGSYGNEAYATIQKSILNQFSLKASELFLSAIHTHSSPILSLNRESGHPNNIIYTETLNQKLLTVIGDAFNHLEPIHTGCGIGYSPVGSNRREMRPDGSITLGRNPYGPADKEVLVMKVATADGNPIGAIFDYATHATSLGPRNMLISGDVIGLAEQFVEQILGEEVVSPAFAGASGDIDPWYRILPEFNTEPGWIPEPVLLGTLLGEEVVTVFRNIEMIHPGGAIKTSFETLECPRRTRNNENSGTSEDEETTVPVNITAARIGDDAAFIGFNIEMLTEIGMAIKAGSPYKHTFIITHCNGSSGYLVPAELYKEGGYEVTSTRFEIGSAEMVVRKALRMLYDLK
ncbi:neutral/alkaline non-lysosomal ceramidase N-terminal domain-containing protein [bacterium]|nr:neutral/alkaline non-lysosomal ceramidase N-terminal domain-containing protein [bacterium]